MFSPRPVTRVGRSSVTMISMEADIPLPSWVLTVMVAVPPLWAVTVRVVLTPPSPRVIASPLTDQERAGLAASLGATTAVTLVEVWVVRLRFLVSALRVRAVTFLLLTVTVQEPFTVRGVPG